MKDPEEEMLVQRLAAEGLVNRRQARPARALAMLALLIGAFWVGTLWDMRASSGSPTGRRYLVLLYDGPAYRLGAGRAAEYAAWAHGPHPDGRIVGGEELTGAATRLGPAADVGLLPAGYFIAEAEDEAALLRLAATCPHLRHGGSIAIRALAS